MFRRSSIETTHGHTLKEKMCPTWKARNDAWVRKRDEKRAKREAKKALKDEMTALN